ncbi:hypothetical protein G9A89_011405 [Geosiphon pyriformis]|nr:hypothetical protein G9A89_011405 [Geosiphon pyriformis]
MNSSLVRHVCKVFEIPGWLLSIKLLFKNKLLVLILGLYIETSLAAVNESFFVVLDGNFNKDNSTKCTSFKRCLNLGLNNSQGVAKTIDYVFIFSNLVNMVVNYSVSISIGLGGLLNTHVTSANALLFLNKFAASIVTLLASKIFKKKWFRDFNGIFTKNFSRFYKLELLVSKIVKTSHKESNVSFTFLIKQWVSLNNVKALIVQDFMNSNMSFDHVHLALSCARKFYHASKLAESLKANEVNIRSAIDKRIESFETNKDHTIRSMMEHPFYKVVLDYLVVNNKLILEPDLVKSKVDTIIKSWTRKCKVVAVVSNNWYHQYQSLEHVFDETFFGVICSVKFDELFSVVFDLPNGKTASLLDVSNELWKYCNKLVLNMLLVLLNSCLSSESVSESWKEAWKDVLINTCPIVLIKTAHKILSDRISLAYSTFNILCDDNFLVLKGTTTQSHIFAIGSVVEDALEKNQELWLVLQNMQKAYNLIRWKHLEKSLVRIKMCGKFIRFFGSIYRDCTNQIMTDFELINGYHHQENMYKYRLNSHFIIKNGHVKSRAGFSFFLAAGAFVDNTIWIDSSQNATQHILNIVSEFFQINDISINNDKIVAILINNRIDKSFLYISKMPISISKKEESYRYLYIFLSTKSLSKLSLAKVHLDIHFFTNLVLKKTVSDKQFLYLVSTVLHLIVNYRTQFSFVFVDVYNKSYDLQILYWCSIYSLSFPVHIQVSSLNNFLADMVHIFFEYKLSLSGSLANFFLFPGGVPMSAVLDESLKNLDTVTKRAGAAAFFKDVNLGLGINVLDLMLSILAKIQAIVLVLECVLSSSFCWVKHWHIVNIICGKNLNVSWHKVKSYSGVLGNEHADVLAGAASLSGWYFLLHLDEHFIVADDIAVSGNSK